MRLATLWLIALAPAAASADVTHHVAGSFGVSYLSDAQTGQSSLQPLYQGRYTLAADHQADNGLRFRFELGIVAGNYDPEERPIRPAPPPVAGTVGHP